MTHWNRLSAFDLDRTLLKKNSSFQFGLYLYRHRHISLRALLFVLSCNIRHSLGWLPIEALHGAAFQRLFKGLSADAVQQWAEDFVADNLDPLIYPPAVDALKQAQQAGHLTVIISSSPRFLVAPIAKRLRADMWEATDYAVDKDRRFCHISKIILGKDKALHMMQLAAHYRIPKQRTIAYSDSHLDLPFMLSAGTAVGVNPNRQLRKACRRNHWPII